MSGSNGHGDLCVHFLFQWEWAEGRILNVGCDCDPAELRRDKGAVNMDVLRVHPSLGYPLKVDIIHDIRDPLPDDLKGRFDTVIFGDVIEHMTEEDGLKSLRNLKEALAPKGHLVITCPHDFRDQKALEPYYEKKGIKIMEEYVPGVTGHHRVIPPLELMRMIESVGYGIDVWKPLNYGFFRGTGAVCEVVW